MTKNIMFQGTSSSAGKSTLVTALCRILKNEGINVSPFKSQNMTRNAVDIGENIKIAGSQVVQAEAAKTKPLPEMNPILLVPNSDTGSKILVNGIDYGNTNAWEYHETKSKFREIVKQSYKSLEERYDIVVIEGAGSPAEINLRENDFVNMGLAEMVDAPVIIVGDIDRGGVFASIYGTIMLMSESEKDRIKGFIINKFRGDIEILKPGIKMIEEKVNKPCLGVVPYFELNIEEEDSIVDGKRGERIEDDELRDKEYDKLADIISNNIDIKMIKEIIGI
ncbi:cobyric acid synthase CobQ [Gottschalkia acidurici 9a]|uniref:Cobyric acid synthase n=1 Tax=Gottschalkia acidurici (strain ATCC 7906 / DSM 604 / BCRC 14475 / CIP 104303 / KCTC 5404 / NCIMB 10678 / 9a) TaxID=1128398 RepID=K0AY18_GOTA9|nr:cobyric acid synthase [Gottschalkia acidurici]AFS77650.1 cobyric acid synthase CobQ [Gottschalkia acidurici 9a]